MEGRPSIISSEKKFGPGLMGAVQLLKWSIAEMSRDAREYNLPNPHNKIKMFKAHNVKTTMSSYRG